MFAARDADGNLFMYNFLPELFEGRYSYTQDCCIQLPTKWLPELKHEDGPIEVVVSKADSSSGALLAENTKEIKLLITHLKENRPATHKEIEELLDGEDKQLFFSWYTTPKEENKVGVVNVSLDSGFGDKFVINVLSK